MSVFLLILKIIGIVLLVILGLIVVIALLALFCPFVYRVKGSYHEKNLQLQDMKIRGCRFFCLVYH